MNDRMWFDRFFESSSRSLASRTSRRSFLAQVGRMAAGAALLPLLPVARNAEAQVWDETEQWFHPKTSAKSDPKQCDYWAYCAIGGWLCSCCGGTSSQCPPGTEPSPIGWVGTCRNEGDGKSYVVSYHDCCGKSQCEACPCVRDEGGTPRYRLQRSPSVTWCYGGVSSTYHCTVSRLISVAE